MADIQFNEEAPSAARVPQSAKTPLVDFLIKMGWAKDLKSANKLMIWVAAAALAATAVIAFVAFGPNPQPAPPVIDPSSMMPRS